MAASSADMRSRGNSGAGGWAGRRTRFAKAAAPWNSCPVERDALNSIRVRQFLAMIYAWSGEKELACAELEAVTKLPASASYGQLKLHPYWDPLRGNPCFEKIVTGLAPATK